MSEYIERGALIEKRHKVCEYDEAGFCMTYQAVPVEEIQQAPAADVVEVVRCGECKRYHEETGYCDKNSHFIDSEGMSCSPAESPNWTIWDENDFCSYGERKDGE